MSFIAISNIEGTDNWKRFISEKDLKNDSHIVFLGDYFAQNDDNSPINERQFVKSIDNFLEICTLAKESPFVHLLLGNRDFQYTPFDSVKTGGYNQKYQKEFEKVLMDNINLFDIVYFYELKTKSETTKFVFSHAGITSCYLNLMNIEPDLRMPYKLNELFKIAPEKFMAIKSYNGQQSSPIADDIWHNPLWIRITALVKDAIPGYHQVVGHSCTDELRLFVTENRDFIWNVRSLTSEAFSVA